MNLAQYDAAKKIYRRLLKRAPRDKRLLARLKHAEALERAASSQPARPPTPTSQPRIPKHPADKGTDTLEDRSEDVSQNISQDISEAEDDAADSAPQQVEITGIIGGWYRSEAYLDFNARRAWRPTDIPEDAFELRNQLLMRVSVRYGTRLHGFASALIRHVLKQEPDPAEGSYTVFNGATPHSEFDVQLLESYLNYHRGRIDVRAGMLRVAWGKTDFASPNDVVNPTDLRNPILDTREITRLPVLAAELSVAISSVTLQALWQPIFRASRISMIDSDFGVIRQSMPAPLRGLMRFLGKLHDPQLTPQMEALLLGVDPVRADPSGSAAGLRATLEWKGVDFDFYYLFGWDPTPALRFDPFVGAALAMTDWDTVRLQDLTPLLARADDGYALMEARYHRLHHLGLSTATTLGPLALRLEGAFDSQRVVYDSGMGAHLLPRLAASFNVEYQHDTGKHLLLELIYHRLFDAPGGLLFDRPDNLAIGLDNRWTFFRGDLVLSLRALLGVRPRSLMVRPEIRYKLTPHWAIYGGAVVLAGEERSFGGYYGENDMGYLGLLYTI